MSLYVSLRLFGTSSDAGFNVKKYTYYDPKTCGLDFDGLLASLKVTDATQHHHHQPPPTTTHHTTPQPQRIPCVVCLSSSKTCCCFLLFQLPQSIADGSIVLLHACAHNPTGVDPTQEQWKSILQVMRSKGHFTLFDFAYHGYATGDLEADAWPIRHWVANGEQMVVCQSYAKNFGLYGERAGTMNVVCSSPGAAEAVLSRIKLVVRPMYSNPPKHGARIVATVLGDPDLYAEWQSEIKMMSGRIGDMRTALRSALEELKVPGDWSHITKQIGMFTFTGLSREKKMTGLAMIHVGFLLVLFFFSLSFWPSSFAFFFCADVLCMLFSAAQVELLLKDHHVYMLGNGRISMAGLSHKTVPYLAQAIKEVVAATASNL